MRPRLSTMVFPIVKASSRLVSNTRQLRAVVDAQFPDDVPAFEQLLQQAKGLGASVEWRLTP